MLTKLMTVLLLMAALVPMKAQTVTTITAPVYFKVASEGANQAASPVVSLTPGMVYRFGSGTKFCDAVTVTTAVNITVWFQTVTCTMLGVATSDPDPGVVKELDIVEQSSPLTVLVFTSGVSSSALVPALPAPPPPTPPALTTYATTCSTVVGPTGAINIILTATPNP